MLSAARRGNGSPRVGALAIPPGQRGAHASLLLRMATGKGGLATARQLLHHPLVSDGFTALWERGRVDLTAEAVVIRPRFRPLFTDEELAIPSNRVVDASAHAS
ncbi:hypothetical protein AB0883_08530 [Micromonospora sp. NPDC047812]|uniref:hypothetical protein n=1 Tax=Micromonospora sp. NPDC047812 TaxID=3155742 RepID=UPI0034558DD1